MSDVKNMFDAMDDLWDTQKACYREDSGSSRFDSAGEEYTVSVEHIDLPNVDLDVFPTAQRVVTQVIRNPDEQPDIVVPVLPGWGETSAQFEGDFLMRLLRVLQQMGYENPKVLGVNCSGRGSRAYAMKDNRDRISRIGFKDEIDDAFKLAEYLDKGGFLGDNMTLIGHSMGALNVMAFLDAVRGETSQRVKKVVHLMPATDKPLGLLRPSFLWAVRTKVLPAIWQYLRGRGYLKLTEEEHFDFMLDRRTSHDMEHFKRGVPDSARRFLELTFNIRRRFEHFLKGLEGVDFDVVLGGKDKLIPPSTIHALCEYLRRNVKGVVKEYTMDTFDHSLPFNMIDNQLTDIGNLFGKVFPQKSAGTPTLKLA